MSDFSLTLVLQIKTSKIINDVAKVHKNLRKPALLAEYFLFLDKKSALLAEYFSFWTNLTVFCPLL